ncbi:hypothetical protein, partial [Caballeronia sp. LZ034LL]|uniref:hypothetical protein n=1 Tax=Caballeronia sp. LZ034LL TaxID=3038567 RepID=UPI002857203B
MKRINGSAPYEMHVRADFGAKTVRLDGLTAELLGGDVRAKGGVQPDGSYAIDVNGRLGADAAERERHRRALRLAERRRQIDREAREIRTRLHVR